MIQSIFYSWQSDSPTGINRSFIEKAIQDAIKSLNVDYQEALRDEKIAFDKDTKNVPGSPPIVETIFEKISKCSVLIPDITFICKAESGRFIPNPNVLIEYGWALKVLGNSRIVPVMNTHYGEPNGENLPFDMRHLRRPITYTLKPDTDKAEKAVVRKQLVKDLREAISLVLKHLPINDLHEDKSYIGIPVSENPSTFLNKDETFPSMGRLEGDKPFSFPDGQRLFLHLIPKIPVDFIKSTKNAIDLIMSGKLKPMGVDRGWTHERNKYGAYACSYEEGKILFFSQLFTTGELWGIDALHIEKTHLITKNNVDFGYFQSGAIERVFSNTLQNYLDFAQNTLKLPIPLKYIAGATDVESYRMLFVGYDGYVVNQHIIYEGFIDSYDIVTSEILMPFFNHLWVECGLERPKGNKL